MFRPKNLPRLTVEQMREVDRLMIEEFSITLLQMMENAGRNLAELVLSTFAPARVLVLAGTGGNGGGGLVAARHLANRGCAVHVTLLKNKNSMSDAAAHQRAIVQRMGIPVSDDVVETDLVIDALFGYSLQGAPKGRGADLITWANGSGKPIVSLDCPSGLDLDTGCVSTPCIKATTTMTVALPKKGLYGPSEVGDLFLADIAVPSPLYRQMGIEIPPQLFASSSLVPLCRTA